MECPDSSRIESRRPPGPTSKPCAFMGLGRSADRWPRISRLSPVLATAMLLLGLSVGSLAQEAEPQPARGIDEISLEERIRLHHTEQEEVRLVMFPATVVNRRGHAIRDLTAQDFQLSENRVPQEIEYFSSEAKEPISVAFLLDLSGSMRQLNKLAEAKEAIRFFVDSLRPGDRFGLVGFADDQVTWITDFTDDRETFLKRLNVQRGFGPTALYDAVAATPQLVDDQIVGRKAIVLITDGIDNASSMDMFKAVRLARSVNVPIYTIGFTHLPAKLVRNGETVRNLRVMRLFAEETGGAVLSVRDPDDLKEAVRFVESELRHAYLLGYYPENQDWQGEFRRVELGTLKDGLEVRTRRGYYARP